MGNTPLSSAAHESSKAVVKLLLDAGSSVDAHDERGRTPLSYGAEEDLEVVVKRLLDISSDSVDKHDEKGRTSRSYAAARDLSTVVELWLDAGSDSVDVHDNKGRTSNVGVQCVDTWKWLEYCTSISLNLRPSELHSKQYHHINHFSNH